MRADSTMFEKEHAGGWTAQQLFVALVPAFFLFALISFGATVILDGDPYWHIAAGEWMLTHGAIPMTDPFSHTLEGAPWTAHEWLTEVILAGAYRFAGWTGLQLLVAVAGTATAFLLARELLKVLDPVPALAVLAIALANISDVAHARPQFLTYPIIVFWIGDLLEARRHDRAPRWILLPLMVLWANLHGGFILGLALLGPFALEAMIAAGPKWRRALMDWALFSVGALIVTLINPSGLEGLIFPFKLMGMPALSFISEWSSSTFERLGTFEVTLLAVLFFCLFRGVRLPFIRLALLLGILHMAFEHRRFAVMFAINAALLLAEPIAAALGSRTKGGQPASVKLYTAATALLSLFVVGLASLRLASPVVIADDFRTPVSALASVPEPQLRQPVFNDYDFGGYLIFKGVRPFIDGRADMYGDAFMHEYFGLAEKTSAEINEALAGRGVTWAIVHTDHPRGRFFANLPGWHLHHKDKFASVFLRDAPAVEAAGSIPSLAPAQQP